MAVQWDALATGDIRVMRTAQNELLRKPKGATWLTYTRCHDDIGLGYDDWMIEQAGYNPYDHRSYIKNYYSGGIDSPATGALFAVNPKTQDARLSGSLASLCGLEKALAAKDAKDIQTSIDKITLMQAQSMFVGGVPMLFYGDEAAYTNDYSYLQDPGKSYDNRWMHRPIIDWKKNAAVDAKNTVENQVFSDLQKLIKLRKSLKAVADLKNIHWLEIHNNSIIGFERFLDGERVYFLFNFSAQPQEVTYYMLGASGERASSLQDLWSGKILQIGMDHEHLAFLPYQFYVLK
jgi:amylosucrase